MFLAPPKPSTVVPATPPRKTSETPPSRAQSPLPLRAIIPAQVQSTKVYAEPPEKKIKNVQSAYIYHNSKPAKVYVV